MIINSVIAGSGGGGGAHLLTFDRSVDNTSVVYSDGHDVADTSENVNIQGGALVVVVCWEGVQFAVTGATSYTEPTQFDEGSFAFVMPNEDAVLSVL